MDSRALEEMIKEQKKQFMETDEDIIEREVLGTIGDLKPSPHIIIISGLRRSGKSTLLKLIRERYYPDEPVYYFNFEDERLLSFGHNDFQLLLETMIKLSGKSKTMFLDEIQNIRGWEIFVRRMHDAGMKIYLTGSNSSMLSRELGTRLTGRYIPIELFPFSFGEYLKIKKIEHDNLLDIETRAEVKKGFEQYMIDGGIPEYVRFERKEFLRSLMDTVLYRDIITRYNITQETAFREMVLYLFSNYGTELNTTRLKRDLGLGSENTVKKFVSYLSDAYLLHTIHKYDPSARKQIYSKKKIYISDPGFIETTSFRFSRNLGKLLENIVFLELKRRGLDIYYHRNGSECDFLIREGPSITNAIQVTAELEDNREREYSGLLEAMRAFKVKRGTIITKERRTTENIEGYTIETIPIWEWILDHDPREKYV